MNTKLYINLFNKTQTKKNSELTIFFPSENLKLIISLRIRIKFKIKGVFMDIFKITGGRRLEGEITISGAKNAVLPIMCAAILGDTPSVLRNVPDLKDVKTMIDILTSLGSKITFEKGTLTINPKGINKFEAPYEMVKKMRASVCVLGPLFAKYGIAKVSLPGGCVIGPRPIDIHLKGLKAIGATCTINHGNIILKGKALGGEVFLGGRFGSSVTATANILMASVLCKGETIIDSAAMEPEVVDLANFLNKMGAKISGIGSHALTIKGVKKLHGCDYTIISDRIEAGTFMIAGMITQGDLFLRKANANHLRALIDKLIETGAIIKEYKNGIRITANKRPVSTDIITLPYPGFPTDLQAQMMALLTISPGMSVITEKIYPERFIHIAELNRMGANISLEGPTAIIKGVKALSGAPVMASDLRASAALAIAALVADGETTIERVYHIDRGYEQIEKKLCHVGAEITRVKGN